MKINYANKYGMVEIELISPYQHVSSLYSKDFPSSCYLTLEEMEKVALITENKNFQTVFVDYEYNDVDKVRAFLLHHESGSMAAACKIVKLVFDENINAAKELDDLNKVYRYNAINYVSMFVK